jgi:short-subunit dehydrogenase
MARSVAVRLERGQVAVVTGAGSGIGLAVARALAARGLRLALVDLRPDRRTAARDDLLSRAPAVSTHTIDVANAAAVRDLADQVRREHGGAALLVTSAGVAHLGPFADTSLDDLAWVMNVNFWGTVHCCAAFLPLLKEGGAGHVVTVSSCFGWVGFPGKAGYCASKFAVRGFSETLRAELRGSGVGVTVAYPGPVATNIVRDGRAADAAARDAEAAFLARRGVAAERVAAKILRGVERNAARVVVGFDYRAIDWLVRLAPTWTQWLVGRYGARFPGTKPSQ